MNTEERPAIKTGRLILRPFTMNDVDAWREYTNDPELVRYLVNIAYPLTRKDAQAFVSRFSDLKSWQTLNNFAIVFEEKVIGETYLNLNLQNQNQRAELGYALSRACWGKGIATEAARAVLDWAFQTYNLNRIYATCDPRNTRSHRVLEKLGMKREGVLRSHLKWNGEWRDQMYYGILRDEWRSSRGK